MDKVVRFTVILDRPFYQPGQIVQGHVICEPHQPIEIDSVQGRIHGEVIFHHKISPATRVLIDEKAEFWRFQTVGEMLGMDEFYDENSNFSSEKPSGSSFSSSVTFPIRIQVPHFAPPSFHCPGSPVNVRFAMEIQLLHQGFKIGSHEENLIVLNYESVKQELTPKPITFQKTFHFPKERSIFVEMLLPTDVFTTTAKIENSITLCNRWKQSLKYVHLNIVRRISALNQQNEVVDTVKIDTTGVGLPSDKRKIAVGETYSFRPVFNIPALPPNVHVNGLFKTEYSLKVSIGRAHNFVLTSFEIPINIMTENLDRTLKEDVLIDVSASNNIREPVDLLV